MGKKHKKPRAEWRSYEAGSPGDQACPDKPFEKPLKLVLKVGGSAVAELSGSGHDTSYAEERSEHEQRQRHKDKKKRKKKKSERDKDRHDEERRERKEEKKRKREEREHGDTEGEAERAEADSAPDRPVRACRAHAAEHAGSAVQQLLERFLRQLQRKDPRGFFAFPVTDAIAPGYSAIIKQPMDFSAMRDKVALNEYKSVTEFKADFKLMCDNAMTYNGPDTVYYKLAKRLLHTGFQMMSKRAALLPDEDVAVEPPLPEVAPAPVEPAKKSKKHVIRAKDLCFNPVLAPPQHSAIFEPEGNACSLTDSTAEEHVLALVEHAADEARDKINRHIPSCKMGYLKKTGDGALVYSVVNQSDPEAEEEEIHPVDLSSLSSKFLPTFTSLGFKEERRNKVTFLSSESTALSLQNNSIFNDLKPDEMELLYSGYGDDTGIQCALSLLEFVKDSGSCIQKMVDDMLDQITGGDHSKAIYQIKQRRNIPVKPPDEVKVLPLFIKEEPKFHFSCPDSSSKHIMTGESVGDRNNPVMDFMSMKSYSDMSLDMSMLNSLGKVKKEMDQEDSHLNLDETTKLLQDLHEAQSERVGSRPSSNLSSLSNTSEREQHNLGSPSHFSVGEQQEMVHDPYEFLQSPDPPN